MYLHIQKKCKLLQFQSPRNSLTFDIHIHTGLVIGILDVSNVLVATGKVARVTSFCVEDSELVASDKGVIRAGVLQDAGPTSGRPSAPSPGNGSQCPENTTQKEMLSNAWKGQ